MRYRYFKAESGPLQEKMAEIIERRKKARDEAVAIRDEFNAAEIVATEATGLVGLCWDNPENVPEYLRRAQSTTLFQSKNGRHVYVPNKRFKKGKELVERFKAVDFPDSQQEAAEILGCRHLEGPSASRDSIHRDGIVWVKPRFGFVNKIALAAVPLPLDDNLREEEWEPADLEGLVEIDAGEFQTLVQGERSAPDH